MRIRQTRRPALIIAIALGIVLTGNVAVLASHQFSDVPDGAEGSYQEAIHDGVDWIVDRNVTSGCGGGNYCPDDDVKRRDMAIFLRKEGIALTPTYLTSASPPFCLPFPDPCGDTDDVDLDAATNSRVFCRTSAHTPSWEQRVTVDASASFRTAASSAQVQLAVVYSNDNSSWTRVGAPGTIFGFANTQYTDTAYHSATDMGTMSLEPGTTYYFGLEFARSAQDGGSQDLENYNCQLMAEINNRNP